MQAKEHSRQTHLGEFLGFHFCQCVPDSMSVNITTGAKACPRYELTIVITTFVCEGLATKSIAPPIPLTLPGSMKFAKSNKTYISYPYHTKDLTRDLTSIHAHL